jgi:hypothetical protein
MARGEKLWPFHERLGGLVSYEMSGLGTEKFRMGSREILPCVGLPRIPGWSWGRLCRVLGEDNNNFLAILGFLAKKDSNPLTPLNLRSINHKFHLTAINDSSAI